MLQKQCILRKILHWSPGKLLEIANFNEKSRKLHGKNPKDTSRTRQNLVKICVKSVKIAENRPKLKNRRKIISKIRKTLKQCSKTGSKTEKHGKTAKILKQCSKNSAFCEKSCTGAQENCSKSRISTKNHENHMVKIPKTLRERVKTSPKYASDPSKSPKIDQKLKNHIKILR